MQGSMYRRIADDLHGKIDSGTLQRGTRLPAESELMTQYGASRNTIRDAIKMLITRGLVETRAGQGTFVTERLAPIMIRQL